MKLTKRIKLSRHRHNPWWPVGYYRNRPHLLLPLGELGRIENFRLITSS